jgi:CBS domain-containing protein
MNAKDVAEPALVFSINQTVNRAATEMLKAQKHEAVVLDEVKFKGIIFANDLVKRSINEPTKAKVGRFVEHAKPIQPSMSIESIIKSFLINDQKSIPMQKGKGHFFITKLAILKAMKNKKEIKGKTASDVMNSPYCISSDDDLATSISVLRETGVSRLPVLDKKNRTVGLIDSLSLLKSLTNRSRMKLGEEVGEKKKLGKVLATNLMTNNFCVVGPDTPLKHVIEMMVEKGAATAVVEDAGKLVGIITPKPIFRLFAGKTKGVFVRISGIKEEDDFIKSVVDEEIGNQLKKLGTILPIKYLVINVDKYHKTGRRRKYSVKARIITGRGMFFAGDHAWDLTKAVQGTLAKLESEILHKIGKKKVYRRAP